MKYIKNLNNLDLEFKSFDKQNTVMDIASRQKANNKDIFNIVKDIENNILKY